MKILSRARVPLALRVSAVAATALVILATAFTGTSSAHGSVSDPPTRNFGCLQRWGDNHLSPEMQTQDPMCYQAWRADPNAMWNWNGLYRENLGGNFQAAIPDGQLCSGGRAESGRYAAMDAVGAWVAAPKPNVFTLNLRDDARHGADFLRVYITKQGFNALTTPLKWSDLEQVLNTGRYAPAANYQATVNAGNRTGRHIVYTIWQASHLDQPYFLCSDVIFGGGNGGGSSSAPPSSAPPSSNPPSSNPPSSNPGTGACTATYQVVGSWPGGFQGLVTVTAGAAPINGWTLNWTFNGSEAIGNSWSAQVTSNGSSITARDAGHNGPRAAGQSTSWGFIGSGTQGAPPTVRCTAR